MSKSVTRLYEQFQPRHYELHLVPDREKLTFAGTVKIDGKKIGRPSQRITFHQNGLKFESAKIIRHDKKGDQEFEVTRINLQKSFDEVRLHADNILFPGEYTIELGFSGAITKTMMGIYPCFFKHDSQDKMLIATQFESHSAREAFPCIDEPEAKATFDLTLTTPKGETVLSNTPIKTQKTEGNNYVTTFETTPRMSTYLLAFAYGEIHCVEGKSKRGIDVRSWATVAHPKSHLEYANKEATALLDFFEEYFNTPFPLPKFDQIALPDFEVGAMENWGLVTFREVALLADPINRSISGERYVTQVVAHEMSHQWFGNLVTMKWWDDLWLNESFASIMESLGPDRLHPEWQEWEDFMASRCVGAANRDIYKDVQPVGVTVTHPDQIHTIFDPAIVYAKGARILKMLYDFIGDDAFRKGLTSYFKTHAYGNTGRDDLWAEFSTASGRDISKLMTPWIEQSGTPELVVKKDDDRLEISQQRFLLDGEDSESIWPIPLLADRKVEPDVLGSKSDEIKSDGEPVFNPSGSGHFIVQYDDKGARQNLEDSIIKRTMPAGGRIVALNDMLLMTQKGHHRLTEILDLVKRCHREDRDGVWSMFARAVAQSQTLTEGDEKIEAKIREYRRDLASYWHEKLGWDDKQDDDANTKHLRLTMLALKIGGEDPTVISEALERFKAAKSVETLLAEQRALIAGAAVRFGKKPVIKQLMTEYEESPSPDVKESIASALCSTRDPSAGEQIVKWGMFDDKVIRPQDISHWFAYLMRNRFTREAAWQWLHDRWHYLEFESGQKKVIEYFIWYSSRPISTPEWQKRFVDFFNPKKDDEMFKRNILIAFSEIDARVAWRRREEPALRKYFLR